MSQNSATFLGKSPESRTLLRGKSLEGYTDMFNTMNN